MKTTKQLMTPTLTTAPVTEVDASGVEIEWARHWSVTRTHGLSRGMLYALEKEGLIKGVSLRRKGQRHGVKLWSMPSIAGYLNALMQEQEQARAKEADTASP